MNAGVPSTPASARGRCWRAGPASPRGPRLADRLAAASRLGQPPVDQQRLAEPAQHQVVRLEVAVQHPLAVRERDRLADIDEPPQKLAEFDGGRVGTGTRLVIRLDGLLEAVALDEPHGVERPAITVSAEAVDRDDPGVLQAAVDLGLQDEPAAEVALGDLVGPDLLEGDLTAELLVASDVHAAQPALAVEAEDAEPRPARRDEEGL